MASCREARAWVDRILAYAETLASDGLNEAKERTIYLAILVVRRLVPPDCVTPKMVARMYSLASRLTSESIRARALDNVRAISAGLCGTLFNELLRLFRIYAALARRRHEFINYLKNLVRILNRGGVPLPEKIRAKIVDTLRGLITELSMKADVSSTVLGRLMRLYYEAKPWGLELDATVMNVLRSAYRAYHREYARRYRSARNGRVHGGGAR